MKRFTTHAAMLLVLLCAQGCGIFGGKSDALAPTQSAIALEKSFTAAVKVARTFPLETRQKLKPYVNEGSAILDELSAKSEGYTKPLTLADFGDVAGRLAIRISILLSGEVPQTRPSLEDAPPASGVPPDAFPPPG